MILADLPASEIVGRCANGGLTWEVGPFVIRVKSSVPVIAHGLAFLYGEFLLVDDEAVVDAEISVNRKRLWPGCVRIRVDGLTQYDWLPRKLAVPMLEWTMNVCVFQRPHEYFMLHSAVVERGGRALLMPGLAGSGKSTLCAGLVSRGWRLLSDEVALVRPIEGDLLPVPRPISLKEESIGIIRRFAPNAILGPEWPGTAKGTVSHVLPPTESVQRSGDPAQPACMVFPSFRRGASVSLTPFPKAQACMRAADNAFNYSVHGLRGFESLTRLVDRCECYELRFGELGEGVDALETLIRPERD